MPPRTKRKRQSTKAADNAAVALEKKAKEGMIKWNKWVATEGQFLEGKDSVANAERMRERAGRNNPDIPTVDELKVAVVLYLNETQPELLACKVETMLKEEGHVVLWTPPYCPELQPIEMFWGAGKNHAALKNFTGRKMRDDVNHLREGWNGNGHMFSHLPHPTKDDFVAGDIHQGFKSSVDCRKLFLECIKIANKKFIAMCPCMTGTVENLEIEAGYVSQAINVPIDAFIINLDGVDQGQEGEDDVVSVTSDDEDDDDAGEQQDDFVEPP
jgi:hypothetical protein